jgi:glycosyltransferase involved in cell wall biosynthesis
MRFSVVIPAYNAVATIKETLNGVLNQTVQPDEILVFDDGSIDGTATLLETFKPAVTVFTQSNHGVAYARNFLCAQARGDVMAFLDADDVWHPCYLELQQRQIEQHPQAVAYFTGHDNLVGHGKPHFNPALDPAAPQFHLIAPGEFIQRYNETPLSFQMSCCCVPKGVLTKLGPEPFNVSVSGADDSYFHNLLPLLGPITHTDSALVVYRIMTSSISANQLKMALLVLGALQLLERLYQESNQPELYRAFKAMVASRKRNCGKYLMGSGRAPEARRLFRDSLRAANNPVSLAKSLSLLGLSYLPAALQPRWPGSLREINVPTSHLA